MKNTTRTVLCLFCIASSSSLLAQMPIPTQIASAKSVFVSNGGGDDNSTLERAYGTFYQGLSQWSHFQLAMGPATAELVLELHYSAPPSQLMS